MSSLIEGLNRRTENLEGLVERLTARIEALEKGSEVVISTVETATAKSIKKIAS